MTTTGRFPPELRAAELWVASSFPQVAAADVPAIVRGVAAIMWPYLSQAATADLSDALAEKFPQIAAGLDEAAHEQYEAMRARGLR